MKIRYILNTIIVIVLCNIVFQGCGNVNGEDAKDPITLTLFNSDLSNNFEFDDQVAKKITELTGVTLKILQPAQGDRQAIDLMIASGEYTDLIYGKDSTKKLIDAGSIIQLDQYILDKGENLKKLYGEQINRLKVSKTDPHIYTVGTYGVNETIFDPSGTVQIQHKALEASGYPKLKNIYDFEKIIADYIEMSPKTEEGEERIGLSLMASDWRWLITCGNIASAVIGIPDDGQYYVDDETGETIYKFTIPEIKEYFKWLNHMNDIGLLDPESFTQSEEVYRKKIASGRVVALSDQKWNYQDAIKKLLEDGKEEHTYAKFPVVLDEFKYKDQTLKNYGFRAGWGISISKTCKDKDRAFEFLDWMASDEAQVLINWGIEGVHYFYNNVGKREFYNEDMSARVDSISGYEEISETGIGYYVYPFPQRANGELDTTGNPYTKITEETVKSSYTKSEKKTLAAYGAESWVDLCTPAEELKISKHGQAWQYQLPVESNVVKIQKKIDEYCQKSISEAILGKPEAFDKAWDEIQSTINSLNVDRLNKEMTKFTEERISLWN